MTDDAPLGNESDPFAQTPTFSIKIKGREKSKHVSKFTVLFAATMAALFAVALSCAGCIALIGTIAPKIHEYDVESHRIIAEPVAMAELKKHGIVELRARNFMFSERNVQVHDRTMDLSDKGLVYGIGIDSTGGHHNVFVVIAFDAGKGRVRQISMDGKWIADSDE